MKKFTVSLALGLMMIAGMSSCFHHRNDMSIKVSDDEDEYEMEANYPRRQSHDVKVYLNDRLLNQGSHTGRHSFKNEEITLDDNTTFYIDSYPGSLQIKINKTENSEEQCERIRQACQELKEILEKH
jgi:hypothetical protein